MVSAGGYHTCGIRTDTSLAECWGWNNHGQTTVSPNVQYTAVCCDWLRCMPSASQFEMRTQQGC